MSEHKKLDELKGWIVRNHLGNGFDGSDRWEHCASEILQKIEALKQTKYSMSPTKNTMSSSMSPEETKEVQYWCSTYKGECTVEGGLCSQCGKQLFGEEQTQNTPQDCVTENDIPNNCASELNETPPQSPNSSPSKGSLDFEQTTLKDVVTGTPKGQATAKVALEKSIKDMEATATPADGICNEHLIMGCTLNHKTTAKKGKL